MLIVSAYTKSFGSAKSYPQATYWVYLSHKQQRYTRVVRHKIFFLSICWPGSLLRKEEHPSPAYPTLYVMTPRASSFAGFSNHIGKQANGGLFSGFLNTYQGGNVFAVGGFANIATGDVKGAQFAGFANIAKAVNGLQFFWFYQ
jgi:hypothetical protein